MAGSCAISILDVTGGWSRTILLGLLSVVVGAAAMALSPEETNAQVSEEFVVRVAARLNPDGRVEFGIQRIDAEGKPRLLHLEERRFFPRVVEHHRWLRGWPSFLLQAPYHDSKDFSDLAVPQGTLGVEARIVARRNPQDSRIEFAIEPKLDARQLPNSEVEAYGAALLGERRFWSERITHHRWQYGTPVRFTRVWATDDQMEEEATLEDDVSIASRLNSGATTENETVASCLAEVAFNIDAMTSDTCANFLTLYCVDHHDFAYCRLHHPREEEQQQQEASSSDPGGSQTGAEEGIDRCLGIIAIGGDSSILPDGCAPTLTTYCAEHPSHIWCAGEEAKEGEDEDNDGSDDEDGDDEEGDDEEAASGSPFEERTSVELQCIASIQPESPSMIGEECTKILRAYCVAHMDNWWCRQEFGSDEDADGGDEEGDDEEAANGSPSEEYTSVELQCIESIQPESPSMIGEECTEILRTYCAAHMDNWWCRQEFGSDDDEEDEQEETSASRYTSAELRCISAIGGLAMITESCQLLQQQYCAENPQHAGCEPESDDENVADDSESTWTSNTSIKADLESVSQERCIELISPESTEPVPGECAPLLVKYCAEHPGNAWCREQQAA